MLNSELLMFVQQDLSEERQASAGMTTLPPAPPARAPPLLLLCAARCTKVPYGCLPSFG